MNKKKNTAMSIGFPSIIMVFIMICLVTFAALSLLTANSDYRLSQKMADKTSAYYEADALAQNVTYQIDQALASLYTECNDAASFYNSINTDFSINEIPEGVYDFSVNCENEVPTISYKVIISDVQTLHVSLEVNYPKNESDCFFTIIQWQTKTSNIPLESDHLNLFGG